MKSSNSSYSSIVIRHSSIALLVLVAFLGLVMSSCADDPPNATGSGLLTGKDTLKVVSFDTKAFASSDTIDQISASSIRLLLGRSQGVESRVLLQFASGNSDFPTAKIDSAVLRLPLTYRFKDSSGTLGFTVHPLDSNWTAGTFTWDSLRAGFVNDTIAATYLDSPSRLSDTAINIRIDTTVVHNWIINGTASMMLIPSAGSTVIAGIANSSLTDSTAPRLMVTYHDNIDTPHVWTTLYTQGVFVANTAVPSSPTEIYVQGAVASRGRISFDVSSIPPRATVTDATMELHYDPSQALHGWPKQDTLFVQMNLAPDRDSLGGFTTLGFHNGVNRDTFQINTMVQQWVSKRAPNYGMVVRVFGEYISADRFAIYGATAADSLRPRLKIHYTILQ